MSASAGAPSLVAVVVARDVETELAALLSSLEAQGDEWATLRVVTLDAGSQDGTADVLAGWAARFPAQVTHLGAESDLPAARNAALAWAEKHVAAGAWVTFPDARDVWAPGFVAAVRATAAKHRTCAVLARELVWDEARGAVDPPRSEGPFSTRDAVVDLAVRPDPVATALRAVALDLDALRRSGLRFAPELASGFGDLDFLARALLAGDARVALARGAEYRFRKRQEEATGAREPFRDPAKFTTALAHGPLRLLEDCASSGRAPVWLQRLVLADVGTYFRADETLSGQMNAEMHHVADTFHSLVERIVALVDTEVLDSLDPATFPLDRRIAFRRGYRGETWHEEPVVLEQIDRRRRLVRLSYRYTGPAPREELLVDGRPAAAHHGKVRCQVYAGRTLVRERILWVSSEAAVEVRLDGRSVPVSRVRTPLSRTLWQPPTLGEAFGGGKASEDLTARGLLGRVLSPRWWGHRLTRTVAGLGPVRRRYKGSWVLLDRVDSGHDNAEHLFKHLRAQEPATPAWFALERGTHDWKRLKREGNRHLLAYGSLRWKLVCLNASHVISSQAGPYVYNPVALRPLGGPSWRFVFLQHGVIATDLSRWLNRRNFDLFLTTTTDEYAAIAGTESMYRFTSREVALTGLPRHDRLFRLNEQAGGRGRRRILVLPSWREYLLGKIGPKGDRELIDDFESTRYARAWSGLLRSPRLAELARRHDATVAFMPHPNIQPYLSRLDLPAHVEVLSYGGNDIQEVLVSAKVVVTDFSSVVFDAAYVGHPIVYYQFDQDEAFGGTHTVRQGYFSYEDDGFGPVVQTEDQALDALERIAGDGFEPAPEYAARMEATFPERDDQSSARVVRAIAAIDAPEPVDASIAAPLAPPLRPTPTRAGLDTARTG
ncbi:CDP-glycerol glycerophosphotransferase family protein [Luteimicrobium sp. DT211]|uniref:CDP-glycerol glycerophosphotransferase family protein n=1 Tax=Luteimicrobium sp. DT211 TaxID=3393412 RepID=UPI003CF48E52